MGSNGITNAELVDLQRTTLANLPDMEFEVALQYQQYIVVNQWFKTEKMQVESGTSIERNIMLDPTGNAIHVRLFQKTPVNVANQHTKITAPWVQIQTSYSIERREALRNRKPAMYIKLLQSRRLAAVVDLANLLERRAWSSPQNEADDLNPRGLPYWISKLTSLTADNAGAFSGSLVRYADGSTSSTKGGINGSTEARWRNWAATYGTTTTGVLPASYTGDQPNSFVQRLRKAFHATNFKSPMLAKEMREGPASRFRLYTNLNTLVEVEELATIKNENIGRDLDPFHGVTTFRRVPIEYAPVLDDDTTNPVYGVNHSKFYPIVQEGDWMRESDPMSDVEQHNVNTTYFDGSYQFFANNVREAGFVLTQLQA